MVLGIRAPELLLALILEFEADYGVIVNCLLKVIERSPLLRAPMRSVGRPNGRESVREEEADVSPQQKCKARTVSSGEGGREEPAR